MKAFLVAAALLGCASLALAQTARVATSYNVVLRTGDESMLTKEGWTFGTQYDKDMKALTSGGEPMMAHTTDFTSILRANGKLYMVAQNEAPNPANVYTWEITQDKTTGKLSPVNGTLKAVDFKPVGGAVYLCSGDKTPWNTHIAGEEWEPDGRTFESATNSSALNATRDGPTIFEFIPYFGLSSDPSKVNITEVKAAFNPYNYGNKVEIGIDSTGNPTVKKWRTLGRHQTELSYTMPDNKTVYITDDGQSKALNVFVMDKAGDLSSGTLWVAKFTQTSAEAGGKFTVKWIEMAKGTQTEIEALVASGIKFSDIFEYSKFDATTKTCPDGFKSINSGNTNAECLKLKAGKEVAATFLETRRYSAYVGGTTEANKWEGITWDADNGYIYTAMTEIRGGMEDNLNQGKNNNGTNDNGGPNDMRVKWNQCGCVYRMAVDPKSSPMLATTMDSMWCGDDKKGNDTNNKCDVDNLASPDNVHYIPGTNTLVVCEDTTSGHQNDVAWLYNVKTAKYTRILTTPFGAETTAPYWYTIDGWSYLFIIIQHPYGESDEDKVKETLSTGPGAYVGYFGPFKSADVLGAALDMEPVMVPRNDDRHKIFASNSLIYTRGVISDTTSPSSSSTPSTTTTAPATSTTTSRNSATSVAGSTLLGMLVAAVAILLA